MELKDLVTEGPILKLSSGLELPLRLFNLRDEIWLTSNYPTSDEYTKLLGAGEDLSTIDDVEVARVIYHQLEDKTPFIAKEFTQLNEIGQEVVTMRGGVSLLAESVKTREDASEIFNCLCTLFIESRPTYIVDNGKKKVKKNQSGN